MKKPGVHDSSEYVLRHRLFEELLKKEEFMEAANCLGKLNLDATGGGKVFFWCPTLINGLPIMSCTAVSTPPPRANLA